jgi:hypothetical protein
VKPVDPINVKASGRAKHYLGAWCTASRRMGGQIVWPFVCLGFNDNR